MYKINLVLLAANMYMYMVDENVCTYYVHVKLSI